MAQFAKQVQATSAII